MILPSNIKPTVTAKLSPPIKGYLAITVRVGTPSNGER